MTEMTLGSLFDGAGGFPLAGTMAGITPKWASEIEPFPIRVTTRRFPEMKHIGNVTEIHGGEVEPVDIITFGSPCQDLSVAGRRQGINGERSGLFHEAIRIIREMREETHGRKPEFIVWENVPGAFSSNAGEDFRTVLEEIAKIKDTGVHIPRPESGKWPTAGEILGDGFSIAWRTVDAQFWGVPQRRKRIYLVADFGGNCAGKIQFERDRLFGDSPQGAGTGQRAAGTAGKNTETSSKDSIAFHLTQDPIANEKKTPCISTGNSQSGQAVVGVLSRAKVFENHDSDSRFRDSGEIAQTVIARYGTGGGNQPLVVQPAISIQGSMIGRREKNGPQGDGINEGVCFTLNTSDRHAVCAAQPYTIGNGQIHDLSLDDKARTLNCMHDAQAVMEPTDDSGYPYIARRLTPLECCRLQGYPDGWCGGLETPEPTDEEIDWWCEVFETHRKAIKPDTKPRSRNQVRKWLQHPQTDSAEYRMWGNSLAIPCAYTVLAGIAEALTESEEQHMDSDDIFTIRARRCKECGRVLVSKESVKRGYGCQCAKKAKQKELDLQPLPGQMSLLDFTESEEKIT